MAIKKGLGKGLDALLGDYQQPPEESVKEIDVNLIDTNSSQPRKSFDKEKLDELANSIKNHGIVQPIVVRRTGERYTTGSPAPAPASTARPGSPPPP